MDTTREEIDQHPELITEPLKELLTFKLKPYSLEVFHITLTKIQLENILPKPAM
jgi:hypothetical protein